MKLHFDKFEPQPTAQPLDDAALLSEAEHLSILIWNLAVLKDDWITWHSTADAFKKIAYYREYDFTKSTDIVVTMMLELRMLARTRKSMCKRPIKAVEEYVQIGRSTVQELDDLMSDWGFG